MRKLKNLARQKDVRFSYERDHGKGSHGRIYFAESFTTIKDPKKEISPGLLQSMCRDLGIDPREL